MCVKHHSWRDSLPYSDPSVLLFMENNIKLKTMGICQDITPLKATRIFRRHRRGKINLYQYVHEKYKNVATKDFDEINTCAGYIVREIIRKVFRYDYLKNG